MAAQSWPHVEFIFGNDSIPDSRIQSQAGCLGKCGPASATDHLQTQRSATKTEQPRSIILDRPVHDLAGVEIRLMIVQPETVTSWHRMRFRRYWRKLSQPKQPGRPRTRSEIRKLIHIMAIANPTWGAPRAHGELKKLGFEISERTVSRLMPKKTGKPSQTWMTFLRNHVGQMVLVDLFTVPTVQLRVLTSLSSLPMTVDGALHFNVTEHPTAAWTAQEIVQAFPDDSERRYLVRDRDGIYGHDFTTRVDGLGIQQVPISARGPWQNCYAERMIGSIRRECLNHVIVINEWHGQ